MAESYGTAIKRLRDERKWTQEELRERANVSRETLSRAENGGNVGVLILYQIADALDVDINVFFGGSPARDAAPPFDWWTRLKREQRVRVERYARRMLGERVPPEESE